MVGQSSDKPGHFLSLLVIPDKTPYPCIILDDNTMEIEVFLCFIPVLDSDLIIHEEGWVIASFWGRL